MANDASIFVHLDQKMSHYIKIVLDEIFGKNQFRNEIVWCYSNIGKPPNTFYPRKHDVILFYSKSSKNKFIQQNVTHHKTNEEYPGPDWWIDIPSFNGFMKPKGDKHLGYPTQKPEALIKRIIETCTDEEDIVLDFFAGSGTTISVAEKLNRKWVAVDIGKLSYLTMQKRILDIKNSSCLNNPKNKYMIDAKSFIVATLGLYDLDKTFNMNWNDYKEFVARLFEIKLQSHTVSGINFDGKKNSSSVLIYNFNKYNKSSIDEQYLNQIYNNIKNKSSRDIYIVAPINLINFVSNHFDIKHTNFIFLKIPNHFVNTLHHNNSRKSLQPKNKDKVNDIEETIGFHFKLPPTVKTKIKQEKNILEICITKFESNEYIRFKDQLNIKNNGFNMLSTIFIDCNYNNKEFRLDKTIFADDIINSSLNNKSLNTSTKPIINLLISKLGKQIKVIYMDIFGNDNSEIIKIK